VYAVVRSAVRQALGSHNLTPTIDFNADVNMVGKLNRTAVATGERIYDEQFGNALQRSNLQNWEKLFDGRENHDSKLFQNKSTPQDELTTLRFESSINNGHETAPVESSLFQLLNQYIVRSVKNGLMIIDQQCAHERILFDRYMAFLKIKKGASQQSLFPQTIDLSATDCKLVAEIMDEIKALGFEFDIQGLNSILITGIPADLPGNERELFEGLIEQFKKNTAELSLPVRENLARAIAKRAAIKRGQRLAVEELKKIVEGLFASSNPNFSPEGNPIFFIFETSKIESYFAR
jgi:DNA mismatch repair protein MutL